MWYHTHAGRNNKPSVAPHTCRNRIANATRPPAGSVTCWNMTRTALHACRESHRTRVDNTRPRTWSTPGTTPYTWNACRNRTHIENTKRRRVACTFWNSIAHNANKEGLARSGTPQPDPLPRLPRDARPLDPTMASAQSQADGTQHVADVSTDALVGSKTTSFVDSSDLRFE